MVFAAIFLDEKRAESRQEAHEEGISEGIARADLAWREWNLRRMAAAHNGVPFTDPPPDFTNGHPNEPA